MYDVFVEWSLANNQADAPFALEIGDQKLAWTATKSGSRATFAKAKVGQIKIAAGAQRAVVRPTGQTERVRFALREVKLVPVSSGTQR